MRVADNQLGVMKTGSLKKSLKKGMNKGKEGINKFSSKMRTDEVVCIGLITGFPLFPVFLVVFFFSWCVVVLFYTIFFICDVNERVDQVVSHLAGHILAWIAAWDTAEKKTGDASGKKSDERWTVIKKLWNEEKKNEIQEIRKKTETMNMVWPRWCWIGVDEFQLWT